MNSQARNKVLDILEIGLIKIVMDWLKYHKLPYKKKDIKRITNIEGYTEAFEVILDKDDMVTDYEGMPHVTEFVEKGEIKIIISIRA